MLYEVAWQAASSATAAHEALSAAAGAQRLPSSHTVPLAAAGASLLVLRSALEQQAVAVQLHTAAEAVPCSIVAPPAASAGDALWGMLRAFAQEAPAVSHGGIRRDLLAPSSSPATNSIVMSRSSGAAKAADGYGSLVQGGSASHAVLLPSDATRAAAALYHLVPRPRGAFRNLCAEPVPAGTAHEGWVEVAVKAVGINFRWVRT